MSVGDGVKMQISAPGIEVKLPEGTPWYGWAVVLLALGGLSLIPFAIEAIRKMRRTERKVESVHEQVANTHDTNLRADIDGVISAVSEVKRLAEKIDSQGQVTATAVSFLTEDARHTRRDLADIRADNRASNEKIDRIAEQLADHLEKSE